MNNLKTNLMRITFLVLSALFLGIGIKNEEFVSVLQKAVTVCLECIGIG